MGQDSGKIPVHAKLHFLLGKFLLKIKTVKIMDTPLLSAVKPEQYHRSSFDVQMLLFFFLLRKIFTS